MFSFSFLKLGALLLFSGALLILGIVFREHPLTAPALVVAVLVCLVGLISQKNFHKNLQWTKKNK